MDHIKLPVESFQPVVKIPYLAQDHPSWAYDNCGFLEYPQRKGFDTRKFVDGQYESSDFEFALAVLQSWCYFGLVIEFFKVFDIEVSFEDFLETDVSGTISVTSARLPSFLKLLETRERKNNDEELGAEQFEALDALLKVACAFVSEIDVDCLHTQFSEHALAQANRNQGLPSVLDVVHLSIIILGQYLDLGAGLINTYRNSWGHSPYLQARLLQAGWCRSETYTFLDRLSGNAACLYYIACISRHTSYRADDHRNCEDSFRCNRENLDRARYKTRHASSCANPGVCPKISFEEPSCPNIDSIVSKGRIPVVTAIPGSKGQKPSCSITSTSSSFDQSHDSTVQESAQVLYVCISHVWSE